MIVFLLTAIFVFLIIGIPLYMEYKKRKHAALLVIGTKVTFETYESKRQRGVISEILYRKHGESPVFVCDLYKTHKETSGNSSMYLQSSAIKII